MLFTFKKRPDSSSAFSEFIRNAKSGEKKRVYRDVLEKASESQRLVVERARTSKKAG
jgi:hypothetical protein